MNIRHTGKGCGYPGSVHGIPADWLMTVSYTHLGDSDSGDTQVDQDYELMAYRSTKIDYEYLINLIQNIVTPTE